MLLLILVPLRLSISGLPEALNDIVGFCSLSFSLILIPSRIITVIIRVVCVRLFLLSTCVYESSCNVVSVVRVFLRGGGGVVGEKESTDQSNPVVILNGLFRPYCSDCHRLL